MNKVGRSATPWWVNPGFGGNQRLTLWWNRTVSRPLLRIGKFQKARKVNLCCGHAPLPDYWNLDLCDGVDYQLDLETDDLPFPDASMDVVVCMSAINYFTRERGEFLIGDAYRVLRPGGIARFGTQDLESIARRYVQRDTGFFFQRLEDGRDRFQGVTMGDKLNSWFYGYETTGGKTGRYFYDYETLALLFRNAGFEVVERRAFGDSRLAEVALVDNRPDQMLFLEAVKAEGAR